VSGAEEGARLAALVFMVGGEQAAVARCRPLLELMGRHVFHVGPLGAGHTMKTINNLATAVTNVSTGASFVSQKRLGQDVVSRKFEDQFRLELMLKDMGIATRLAEQRGLPVPISDFGRDLWARAVDELGAGRVTTEIVRWYEQRMGFELKD
jgi:3-hydroxyisobutyrate dehydrogenase